MGNLVEEIKNIKCAKNSVAIVWIGQGSFIFKTYENKIIYVDPYLSDSVFGLQGEHRLVEIPINPSEVKADLVFVTHDHLDHLDPETIIGIAKSCKAKFIGPKSCYKHFRELGLDDDRVIEINRGEEKKINGIKVSAVHAEHSLNDCVGYIFYFNNIIIYISGDTRYSKKLEKVKNFNPDIVIICTNGKPKGTSVNLNAEEAAGLVKLFNPSLAIPMHYGMLSSVDEDPQKFVTAMSKFNLSHMVKIMHFKEIFIYNKGTN
jgi:L-ascorbate 6-phosphate lactonase